MWKKKIVDYMSAKEHGVDVKDGNNEVKTGIILAP